MNRFVLMFTLTLVVITSAFGRCKVTSTATTIPLVIAGQTSTLQCTDRGKLEVLYESSGAAIPTSGTATSFTVTPPTVGRAVIRVGGRVVSPLMVADKYAAGTIEAAVDLSHANGGIAGHSAGGSIDAVKVEKMALVLQGFLANACENGQKCDPTALWKDAMSNRKGSSKEVGERIAQSLREGASEDAQAAMSQKIDEATTDIVAKLDSLKGGGKTDLTAVNNRIDNLDRKIDGKADKADVDAAKQGMVSMKDYQSDMQTVLGTQQTLVNAELARDKQLPKKDPMRDKKQRDAQLNDSKARVTEAQRRFAERVAAQNAGRTLPEQQGAPAGMGTGAAPFGANAPQQPSWGPRTSKPPFKPGRK